MTLLRNTNSYIISPLTAFGDLRTAELSPVFQHSFEYTVNNTELTASVLVNGGTVTQSDAMGVVSTSTTTASVACLQSKRQARYRSGQGGLARISVLFNSGVSGTEQYAGVVDEAGSSSAFKNGYAVGFNGTTFGLHRFQNDSQTTTTSLDDPLDGTGASGMTIDHTKLNIWEIRFKIGGGIDFLVEDGATGDFVLVHTLLYSNNNIIPSVYMPNFHIMLYSANKATTTDITLKTDSFSYFTEGTVELINSHIPQQTSGVRSKSSVTTEVAIFTIRNKALYASKTNFIELMIESAYASVEANSANNLAEMRIVRNATLGGTPSYSDINTSDSIVDIDTAGTTVSGGTTLLGTALAGKNDREAQDLTPYKFILAAGETLTLAATSANSATIKAGLLWKELF